MKNFSAYYHETNKVYEFRIKLAHVEPKGEVLDKIKNALNAFQVESVSPIKRLPIADHWEFANEGACECYVVDIGLRYPTIPGQIRQLVNERAGINASWLNVKTLAEALNDDLSWAQAEENEKNSPILEKEELGGPSGQDLVGDKRLTSLIKELSNASKKFDVAGTEKADGKTTNEIPQGNTSPIGTLKNSQGK